MTYLRLSHNIKEVIPRFSPCFKQLVKEKYNYEKSLNVGCLPETFSKVIKLRSAAIQTLTLTSHGKTGIVHSSKTELSVRTIRNAVNAFE